MKKYLLPESGNFYKANLHCHSTFSDGAYTPQELKKLYMEQGYSVIAYTDHEIFIPHNELCDDSFVALNGCEMSVSEQKNGLIKKCCHLCMIALDENNNIQPCWHRSKYLWGNAASHRDEIKFDETLPDYERCHSHEGVTDFINRFSESGFFVTYNHPAWSLEDCRDFVNYSGMHAMEIFNTTSVFEGYPDYNEKEYDQMLRAGKRIYCIADDDNHGNLRSFFGGFTMIKAEGLSYKNITNALLKGNFYSSQGPTINELWFENGEIHITCSNAKRIIFNTAVRKTGVVENADNSTVNKGSFKVMPEYQYVRVTVIGEDGKPANTNAYFIDELLSEK